MMKEKEKGKQWIMKTMKQKPVEGRQHQSIETTTTITGGSTPGACWFYLFLLPSKTILSNNNKNCCFVSTCN
jgi:hypothetical protein